MPCMPWKVTIPSCVHVFSYDAYGTVLARPGSRCGLICCRMTAQLCTHGHPLHVLAYLAVRTISFSPVTVIGCPVSLRDSLLTSCVDTCCFCDHHRLRIQSCCSVYLSTFMFVPWMSCLSTSRTAWCTLARDCTTCTRCTQTQSVQGSCKQEGALPCYKVRLVINVPVRRSSCTCMYLQCLLVGASLSTGYCIHTCFMDLPDLVSLMLWRMHGPGEPGTLLRACTHTRRLYYITCQVLYECDWVRKIEVA